jgi:hypothetical protein
VICLVVLMLLGLVEEEADGYQVMLPKVVARCPSIAVWSGAKMPRPFQYFHPPHDRTLPSRLLVLRKLCAPLSNLVQPKVQMMLCSDLTTDVALWRDLYLH